ncbi:hypothetical protein PCANB_000394 [Pneumocystis canis]|nr:hypothetical protein PCK1_000417 [Pneumocystis canis]KAG5438047.1 hypothetical protein PCANB_000394 [Pneumocystis canis]
MHDEIINEEKTTKEEAEQCPSDILNSANILLKEAEEFYNKKLYEEAVETYSCALEKFIQIYGEGDLKNADIIYAYGRSLFNLAVKKSGVFGGTMLPMEGSTEEMAISNAIEKINPKKAAGTFCFFGDESSEDEEKEDDDDFKIAWETLDFARVLYQKMLNAEEKQELQTLMGLETPPKRSQIQKKLADTYDLLGEISLENENFQQASIDFQFALDLKSQIYPLESSLISEAHYKLALAFEFLQDDSMREKAIEHVQWSIKSLEKRIEIEQQNKKGKEKQTKEIEEMQEMLTELKQKIDELRCPPEKLIVPNFENIVGNSRKNMEKKLSEIISSANNLNSLVKKKKKMASSEISKSNNENKSHVEHHNKKVKFEDITYEAN